jgi:hypothetical protein
MTQELRRHKRIPLLLDVRWDSLSGNHTARTGDISLGGCYIESLAQVSLGENISFDVQLPTGRWMRLRGKVAYHLPHMGFGVRFTDLPDIERELLSQLIDFASYI